MSATFQHGMKAPRLSPATPPRSNPNPGAIIIPASAGTHADEEEEERNPGVVWHRPHKERDDQAYAHAKGKVYKLENMPVRTDKYDYKTGDMEVKFFAPLQAAIMAATELVESESDYVRVHTPAMKGKAEEYKLFKVAQIVAMARDLVKRNPIYIPIRKGRVLNMEEDGDSLVPRRWSINDNGVFAPKF